MQQFLENAWAFWQFTKVQPCLNPFINSDADAQKQKEPTNGGASLEGLKVGSTTTWYLTEFGHLRLHPSLTVDTQSVGPLSFDPPISNWTRKVHVVAAAAVVTAMPSKYVVFLPVGSNQPRHRVFLCGSHIPAVFFLGKKSSLPHSILFSNFVFFFFFLQLRGAFFNHCHLSLEVYY